MIRTCAPIKHFCKEILQMLLKSWRKDVKNDEKNLSTNKGSSIIIIKVLILVMQKHVFKFYLEDQNLQTLERKITLNLNLFMWQEVSIFCVPLSDDQGVRILLCNPKVAKYREIFIFIFEWLYLMAGQGCRRKLGAWNRSDTVSFPVLLLFCFTCKQVKKIIAFITFHTFDILHI